MKGGLRVLILEDRVADASLMVHELRRHGFEVDWSRVETREDFVAGLERAPDIVLADYALPQLDALEALRLARERRPEIPVIVVTGAVGEEAAVECLHLGAVDYLLKDRLARLGGAVDRALELRRLQAESRGAEEALRESESKSRSVSACAQDAIIVLDREGKVTDWNAAAEKIFGYTTSEVLGQDFHCLAAPARHHLASRAGLSHFAETGSGPVVGKTIELTALRRGGGEFPIELSISSVQLRGQWHAIGIVRDITERKKGEDALRRSEEKYRLFFELDLAGHFVSTPEGRILACNPAFARTFGFSSVDEAMSRNMVSFYKEPGERATFLEGLKARGRVERYEKELRRQDGGPVFVIENSVGTFDERGQLVAIQGIIIDETERHQAERELRQTQKMEAIGRLAGGVAHDFNNLLTVINGYADLVLSKLAEEDPIRPSVAEIQAAGTRAARLTGQLLAFSRRQVLRAEILNLNTLLGEEERMLQRLIGEDVLLKTTLAPEIGAVEADHGQIEQIVLNLAVNAREAMPDGGSLSIETSSVTLDAPAAERAHCPRPGRYSCIRMTDTGCGMSEEVQSHVFEPFFTTKEDGTGLGLSTVYGIVRQSGGGLEVESHPGRGTTFRIYLPEVVPGAASPPSRESGAVNSLPGATVLLVEDDDGVRALVEHILSSAGLRTVAARNAADALEAFERHGGNFDLLVTDIVVPGISGPALAEELRRRRPELKVLLMSGYLGDSTARQRIAATGQPFIQKPFASGALLAQVADLLGQPAEKV